MKSQFNFIPNLIISLIKKFFKIPCKLIILYYLNTFLQYVYIKRKKDLFSWICEKKL